MRSRSTTLGFIWACLACQSGRVDVAPPRVKTEGATSPSAGSVAATVRAQTYGASFESWPSIPLATLLTNPQIYVDKTLTTAGEVQRVCRGDGCWMEIGEGEDRCRVTFKDHGFFVPTDSAGAYARIQGKLATRVVTAAEVQHLESEGARFKAKKPDGSATEVRLIAGAVELGRHR